MGIPETTLLYMAQNFAERAQERFNSYTLCLFSLSAKRRKKQAQTVEKGQNKMTKEETAVNISAIKKYIEKTKVPEEILKRYPIYSNEVVSLKYYGQELGMLKAISLAFNFGFCKGYRRGKNENLTKLDFPHERGKYENLKKHEIRARV